MFRRRSKHKNVATSAVETAGAATSNSTSAVVIPDGRSTGSDFVVDDDDTQTSDVVTQRLQRNLFVSRSGRYKSKSRQRARLPTDVARSAGTTSITSTSGSYCAVSSPTVTSPAATVSQTRPVFTAV